MFYFNFRSL